MAWPDGGREARGHIRRPEDTATAKKSTRKRVTQFSGIRVVFDVRPLRAWAKSRLPTGSVPRAASPGRGQLASLLDAACNALHRVRGISLNRLAAAGLLDGRGETISGQDVAAATVTVQPLVERERTEPSSRL